MCQLRTLYFYMYTHPGKKLNFMGNELGHFREWDEKKELDWGLMKYPFHDSFQKYFAELGRLYATEPALYDGEYNPNCFEWIACESRDEGVYAWLRKGAGQTILCVMNTQNTAHKKFPLYFQYPCTADELLNSEAACWNGADRSRTRHLHTTDGGVYGRDYTLSVDLPAMAAGCTASRRRLPTRKPHKPLPVRPPPRSARPPSRQSRIPKSNIAFKISRLLKCRRDILSSGGLPPCLRCPGPLYCKL